MQTTNNTQLHPVIHHIFQKRGLDQEEFLSWNLKDLPNLTDLKDILKAAKRIIHSIEQNEKIGNLIVTANGGHVHFSLKQNNEFICPKAYFTEAAYQSIMDINI